MTESTISTVGAWQRRKDIFTKHHLLNDDAVCRTAPATPGLLKISLQRRHAQIVKNCTSSHNTNYIDIFLEILNLAGHQNHCFGSTVTAILLNWWILPTGGVVLALVCACSLHSRLVFFLHVQNYITHLRHTSGLKIFQICYWLPTCGCYCLFWNNFKFFATRCINFYNLATKEETNNDRNIYPHN